jgi:hypothetical protein
MARDIGVKIKFPVPCVSSEGVARVTTAGRLQASQGRDEQLNSLLILLHTAGLLSLAGVSYTGGKIKKKTKYDMQSIDKVA